MSDETTAVTAVEVLREQLKALQDQMREGFQGINKWLDEHKGDDMAIRQEMKELEHKIQSLELYRSETKGQIKVLVGLVTIIGAAVATVAAALLS